MIVAINLLNRERGRNVTKNNARNLIFSMTATWISSRFSTSTFHTRTKPHENEWSRFVSYCKRSLHARSVS